MTVTPQQLNQFLNHHFSLGELRTLCFELNIPYDDLEGGDARSAKVLALVQYAQRHGMYDTLVTHAQAQRPNARMGDTAVTSPTATPQPTAQTPIGPVYNITVQGNLVGSSIGGGTVNAQNIAGRDIIIGQPPQNRDEFAEQLKQLQALLQEAIANGEISAARDAKEAAEDVEAVIEETKNENPDRDYITRKLDTATKILNKAEQVTTAAGKVGTIALKAAPLAATLLKAVQTLF